MTDDAMLARILAGDLEGLEHEPDDQVARVAAMADGLGRIAQQFAIERAEALHTTLLLLARSPEQRARAQARVAAWRAHRAELEAEDAL